MTVLLDAVTVVLFAAGAGFCCLSALGLLRFPNVVTRLHTASNSQTLGLVLVLVGTAAQMPLRHAAVLLVVAVFQLFTAPIASQIIARTAHRTHAVERDRLLADALADRLARDGTPLHGPGRPERDTDEER
ncbi:monovalent cation/H(+) antiporter subunit G [Streptomyces sp. enrichment culture]|uniref:monovalent cation/H(+) antiporter subunit G n=1 Tax=Streptomyces sp. enrichment culture TaxID=1795815 RepID=UPI003F545013